jgi:hypothetical protein
VRADTIIEHEGLGEPFDYTEWQRDLFKEMPLEELGQKAMLNRHQKQAV